MDDRRTDPRTDAHFSLRNLLRVRSARMGVDLAVLSTHHGVVMAGSREDDAAERVAAHAAFELCRPGKALFDRFVATTGESERMAGLRFAFEGTPMTIALLEVEARPRLAQPEDGLREIADRVLAILSQQRVLMSG